SGEPRHGTPTARSTPRPSSATTRTGRSTSWTSPATWSGSHRIPMKRSAAGLRPGRTPSRHSTDGEATIMDTELILTGAFLGTGLLAYVVIPGLLVMWDRVLDHMEESDGTEKK